ncbi:MAG: acetoin utilization protein AcuC [Candidatus Njordarchaeales archaeon]
MMNRVLINVVQSDARSLNLWGDGVMKCALIYSKEYERVNYGPDHPFRPERFLLTIRFFKKKFPELPIIKPNYIDLTWLRKVHSEYYIEKVRKLSEKGRGYLSIDTPVFKGIYEWALLYCGGSLLGAEKILKGEYAVIFNPCGGLHHAKYNDDGGFCVFNDVALAAFYIFQQRRKVAVVDIDAHAGDGTMQILYDKPILKISVHEDPTFLYPGIGFVNEVGEKNGYGYSLNIPLPPGSSDQELIVVFEEIVIPALKRYNPDYLILQSGVDGYRKDPLTHLEYTAHGYHEIATMLRKLNIPILMLGGGGYYLPAVPILWATIFATLVDLFDRIQEDATKLDPSPSKSNADVKEIVSRLVENILENHPFFKS